MRFVRQRNISPDKNSPKSKVQSPRSKNYLALQDSYLLAGYLLPLAPEPWTLDLSTAGRPPATRTVFSFAACPPVIAIALRGTPNARAKRRTSSSLAAPSTGGAAIRTRNAPSCSPTSSLREARGTTLTLKISFPSLSVYSIISRITSSAADQHSGNHTLQNLDNK